MGYNTPMLDNKDEDCDLTPARKSNQDEARNSQRQIQHLVLLAGVTGKLPAALFTKEDRKSRVKLSVCLPVELARVDAKRSRLENLQKVLNKIFPGLFHIDSSHTRLLEEIVMIKMGFEGHFFEEIVKSPSDFYSICKERLSELGKELTVTFYNVKREALSLIFHDSEISFAGFQALESPLRGEKLDIKGLFKTLKKHSSALASWKTLLGNTDADCANPVAEETFIHQSEVVYLKPTEEDKLEQMPTADGTLQESDSDFLLSPQFTQSKNWLAYIPCDSMPILKEDNQSSCETSRSVASRGGSLYPERVAKVSTFANNTLDLKKSKLDHKQLLKTTERELEAALEDSLDSEGDESELNEALEYIHWFLNKILEEVIQCEKFLAFDFGEETSFKLKLHLEAKHQKLVNFLCLRLMGTSYDDLLDQEFGALVEELTETPKSSEEDPSLSYLTGVLAACHSLHLLSPAAADSVCEQVTNNGATRLAFASRLADFCEFRLLDDFLLKLINLTCDN